MRRSSKLPRARCISVQKQFLCSFVASFSECIADCDVPDSDQKETDDDSDVDKIDHFFS